MPWAYEACIYSSTGDRTNVLGPKLFGPMMNYIVVLVSFALVINIFSKIVDNNNCVC